MVDPNIKRKADDIRTKVYGREVRESLASGLEAMSSDVVNTVGRQDEVESQWQNVVDETTGKDVVSAPEIISARDGEANLKARLDKENQEVTTQIQDVTTQVEQKADRINPVFHTSEETEEVTLGSELVSGSDWTSTGWTGSEEVGFTHQAGNESPLTKSFTGEGITNIYFVEFRATNTGQGPGGTSDFYVTIGDSFPFETYKGTHSSAVYSYGLKTNQTVNELKITPRSEYTGAISNISVREVVLYTAPTLSILDSGGNRAFEMRTSESQLENLFIGENSGRQNISGERNTSFGVRSLRENTTGFWNVAQGFEALMYNTVGTRNVALGHIALKENISGDRNIGIGSHSLTRNKTGRANIGVGADTAYFLESGNFNVAIGLVALGGNIDGDNNVAIGERTMGQSKHGSSSIGIGQYTLSYNEGENNIGLGRMAGYHNREGNDNIAVGFHASQMNREGDYNIALGRYALTNNLTDENIAIGFQALFNTTTGRFNLAIGTQSGMGNETGEQNIYLGRHAARQSEAGSNNIAFGFRALENNNQGNNNVAIGIDSSRNLDGDDNVAISRNSLANLAGRGNIGIGASAGARTDATGDYNIFVGFSAGTNHNAGDRNIVIGYNLSKTLANTSDELNIGDIIKSRDMTTGVLDIPKLRLLDLPTTQPSTANTVWNDEGILKIT